MSAQPPSSPNEPAPSPRFRPPLGTLAQDTTEVGLWAFDDEPDAPQTSVEERDAVPLLRSFGKDLPAPRSPLSVKPREIEDSRALRPFAGEGQIRININKAPASHRPSSPLAERATHENTFDDLDSWNPVPEESSPEPGPTEIVASPASEPTTPPQILPEPTPRTVDPNEGKEEFSPAPRPDATPVSLRPHLALSKTERLGFLMLLLCLLAGAGSILLYSLKHLPTEPSRVSDKDFPITGSHLTILSATSYWRTPISSGASADTFRRGTQLLPVLELAVRGGPGAIRVMFRNEDRAVVGDAVTRTVRDGDHLHLTATAGFDDLGMHAAYRTGESKPWTIEVLEAPSETAAGKDFQPLFEMNISTDRR